MFITYYTKLKGSDLSRFNVDIKIDMLKLAGLQDDEKDELSLNESGYSDDAASGVSSSDGYPSSSSRLSNTQYISDEGESREYDLDSATDNTAFSEEELSSMRKMAAELGLTEDEAISYFRDIGGGNRTQDFAGLSEDVNTSSMGMIDTLGETGVEDEEFTYPPGDDEGTENP
ncbi:MAG: hypothetical protein OHK0017_07400 [Patescibacteria group bacterium]